MKSKASDYKLVIHEQLGFHTFPDDRQALIDTCKEKVKEHIPFYVRVINKMKDVQFGQPVVID